MKKFIGFTEHETFSRVPDSLVQSLLPEIESADELKVTLYAIWRFEHMESRRPFLRASDFSGLVTEPAAALELAVQRGTLLRVDGASESLYFLNSPRGRAAAGALTQGHWQPGVSTPPPPDRPNIYKLYEENIGPLTPLLADALKDAEQSYPPEWVADALAEAVLNNKRSWKYVEAILRRWKEEGHGKEQNRRDSEEPRGRDVTRKVEDFLKR